MDLFNKLHSDTSHIYPGDVKTTDEGKGKLYASIGKEIDEHDVIGKVGGASSFAIKILSFTKFLYIGGIILFLILTAITFLIAEVFRGGANSKEIWWQSDNKRIITTDGVKEYQIKDSTGSWYIVDEDKYNATE